MSETVYRPWGYWKVLSYEQKHRSQEYKVKELTINPGQSISFQKHKHRAEKWIVISGELEIYKEYIPEYMGGNTLKEMVVLDSPIDSFNVLPEEWHTAKCVSDIPCRIIEIQYGNMCVENDIERKERENEC